jgi:Fe2+ transport system protein FeoA
MRSLIEVKEGEIVLVNRIVCGVGIKHRLCTFGVSNGQKLEIIKNDLHGPIILKIHDSKLVVGREEALNIFVG